MRPRRRRAFQPARTRQNSGEGGWFDGKRFDYGNKNGERYKAGGRVQRHGVEDKGNKGNNLHTEGTITKVSCFDESNELKSFYFTNIPDDVSHVELREGFSLCGMLLDVYLAAKRNTKGKRFSFVRFRKVIDVA